MFSVLLQATRGILNSLTCVVYFSNNFNNVFHRKGSSILLALSQYSMYKNRNKLDTSNIPF